MIVVIYAFSVQYCMQFRVWPKWTNRKIKVLKKSCQHNIRLGSHTLCHWLILQKGHYRHWFVCRSPIKWQDHTSVSKLLLSILCCIEINKSWIWKTLRTAVHQWASQLHILEWRSLSWERRSNLQTKHCHDANNTALGTNESSPC